jgi:hypothetical protein
VESNPKCMCRAEARGTQGTCGPEPKQPLGVSVLQGSQPVWLGVGSHWLSARMGRVHGTHIFLPLQLKGRTVRSSISVAPPLLSLWIPEPI